MNITTIGIDLAKNVFQIHGVDERGKTVLRKAVKRAELTRLPSAYISVCLNLIVTPKNDLVLTSLSIDAGKAKWSATRILGS